MKMTRKMCVLKNKYSFILHDYIIKYEEQVKMYERNNPYIKKLNVTCFCQLMFLLQMMMMMEEEEEENQQPKENEEGGEGRR